MENIMQHIDETGKFTDSFKDNILAVIGEEHKGTKLWENIPDVATAFKVLADTKSAFGKKLENVIQRPADDASDEDKEAYRKSLLKELGATDNADDFEFPRMDGVEYGEQEEENEAAFRKFFLEEGVSPALAKKLVELGNQAQVGMAKARLEAEQRAFETECGELDKDWPGDKTVENNRIAHDAMMEFSDDALKSVLKDAKIYDDAGNHTKWRDVGVSVRQRRIWHNIGVAMKSAEYSGGGSGSDNEEESASGGSNLVGKGRRYDHPTSKTLAPKAAE